MQAPILTAGVAARIDRAVAGAAQSRIAHIARLSGNPLDIEIRRWDHATGIQVRRGLLYYHYFNALHGLGLGDESILDEALAWYRAGNVACRMSLSPFWADERLVSQLTQRGFRFAQFMTTVFGEPDGDMPPPSADVVVRYLPPAELNGFLAVWLHGRPGDEYEALAPIVQAEFAEWRCYVAFYQSHAAGVAALHVRDGVGVLAAGETLSEFRGHGAQTTLLHQRIADARALGCDLVVSQATPTTTSQRNMERVGFRTAYTQTVWVDCR